MRQRILKSYLYPLPLGTVGMAAAAAIVSSKKKKRPHSFETNPSIRKRQQNRLLRKLKVSFGRLMTDGLVCCKISNIFLIFQQQTIDEFATRVGQQAVVLVATPGKPNPSFKCFGAKPLEDVVRNQIGFTIFHMVCYLFVHLNFL